MFFFKCKVDLQILVKRMRLPTKALLRKWAEAGVVDRRRSAVEICLRIVDEAESAKLNKTYRKKSGPTNVLSFPFKVKFPIATQYHLLGDVVLCAPLIAKEAAEQNKTLEEHWAHLVIHGVLHLQGYDHVKLPDAAAMEHLEVKIMRSLGLPHPYRERAAVTSL